ncbi:MAG: superinfection immunity protein [Alphaproteobacteria bacterium]|nr:superinfection immunity protein [Alphaproteobacteria bacterium]
MIIELILFLILAFVYFLPTIVAYSRNHTNALAILILNLFLGYTLIGWVVALIWAVYKKENIKPNKRK